MKGMVSIERRVQIIVDIFLQQLKHYLLISYRPPENTDRYRVDNDPFSGLSTDV